MDLLYMWFSNQPILSLYLPIACAKKMENVYVDVIYNIMRTIKIKPCNEGKDVNTKSSVCAVNGLTNKTNKLYAVPYTTINGGDSCANVALGAYSSHNTLPDFLWCPPDVLLCPGNTRRHQQQQPHPLPRHSTTTYICIGSVRFCVRRRRRKKNLLKKKEEKKLRADDSMTVSAAAILSDFIGAQRIRNRLLGSGGS